MSEKSITKEYHFHTYFHQNNRNECKNVQELYNKITKFRDNGYFTIVPGRLNMDPVGPHAIGSFETWVPIEYFAKTYDFFLKNRGEFSVLIHPLTINELNDHTSDVAWIGFPVPLDISPLKETLDIVPMQYPELKLGYSAPEEN